MNFLAHFHLAHPTDASRVGALLGDFVRGTPQSLIPHFPQDVIEGIMLHRAIDHFTDHHEAFLASKSFLSPERRRFAGIIIDVFFDHFLTSHWDTFGTGSLQDFIAELYALLLRRQDWLTPELQAIVPRMKEENWLQSYATIEGLALTFQRISRRRDFLTPLIGAEQDLTEHYQDFETAFHRFYPELLDFAASFTYPNQQNK